MEIILKNGEKIVLEWNPFVIEYLEDYPGGIEKLIKDWESGKNPFRIYNFIMYCFVKAVYPTKIGYREAVSLINPNDLERIVNFACEKINSIDLEKKTIKFSRIK